MCLLPLLNTTTTKQKLHAIKMETVYTKSETKSMLKKKDSDYNKSDKDEKKVSSSFIKALTVFLIIVNVVLLVALVGLVVYWRGARIESLKPHEQTICLPCTEMGVGTEAIPEDLQGKITRSKADKSEQWTCCGKASSILDRLVSESIKNSDTGYKSSIEFLTTDLCNKTQRLVPSAQMNGISFSEMAKGKGDVILWNTTGVSFLKGITYTNGRLSVEQPGYYYIFSQLKIGIFNPTMKQSSKHHEIFVQEHFPSHIDQYIYRHSRSDGRTQKILEASKSSCEMAAGQSEVTSSIGAVFYMDKHDEVFMNTSHPQFLVPSQEGNHFGLYLT